MATTESNPPLELGRDARDSITAALDQLEARLNEGQDQPFGEEYAEALSEHLRRLHAQFRIHRAGDLNVDADVAALPPELIEVYRRLQAEHPVLVGQLDRLTRSVESMPDRPPEDKDVFILCVRELIATLRRHLAEEDRLLCLALWHDTGGES